MIKRNGADCVKLAQIILVSRIVPVPCNNVKRGVIIIYLEEFALELVDKSPLIFGILIP